MRTYQHVILVGIDGGGSFLRDADTPNIDRIFAPGAITYNALASYPSISAECWASMMTGVSPFRHGRTNTILSTEVYPADSAFPTLFRRIRAAYPDAVLGAYCDWTPLIDGLVEDDLGVDRLSLRDAALLGPICDYITEKKPDFLFIHSDSVDGAGHGNGYGTPAHLAQIGVIDGWVNSIYEAVCKAGMADDTLFMLVCDHGGTCEPRKDGTGLCGSHGGWSKGEREITVAAVGKSIRQGQIGPMNIRDVAAVVCDALGLDMPAFDLAGWTAQIPEGLLKTPVPAYRDISEEEAAAPRISEVPHSTRLS